MINRVIKRDNTSEEYDFSKIRNAILQATLDVDDERPQSVATEVALEVENKLEQMFTEVDPTVEEIQDIVEDTLIENQYSNIAKAYILYRRQMKEEREQGWFDLELGKSAWERKYQYKDESFLDFLQRISGNKKEYERIIRRKEFCPAGRLLSNRGIPFKDKKTTYANCYYIPIREDSLEGIYRGAYEMARTYSYGGGVGIDYSILRPKGAKVNNAAKTTTGSVSFLPIYGVTGKVIGQKNRRGAGIGILDISHPDIVDFIEFKQDLENINSSNLSVKVTDEFMEAVENDEQFELKYDVKDTGEIIDKEVSANHLMNKLAYTNYDYAEPGTLFWDRIKNWHIMSEHDEYQLKGVNPCHIGSHKLLTKNGYKRFDKLAEKNKVEIVNKDNEIVEGKVWETGEKEIVEVSFWGDWEPIKCTPDHVYMINNGKKVKARDLEGKRVKPFIKEPKNRIKEYEVLGFIQGDGNLTRLNSNKHKGIGINISEKDNEIKEMLSEEGNLHNDNRTIYTTKYNNKLKDLEFVAKPLPNRTLPKTINQWSYNKILSFLRGLYSANGSVIGNTGKGRITLKSTCLEMIKEVKDILDELGINSYITTNKSKKVEFKNGDYICKESYDLNINHFKSKLKFHNKIGFIQEYKNKKLKKWLNETSPKVKKVEKIGKEKVYDFSEPKTHWGVVDGLISHNCGERPLPEYGACALSSINLASIVDDPYTEDAAINLDKLRKLTHKGVKYLNEVLDEGIDRHPLEEQKEVARKYRDIGLGVMGFADLLIKMGITYGSDESIRIIEEIGETMIKQAIYTSTELAEKNGPFPAYDDSVLESSFIQQNADESLKKRILEYGLRNASLLSIAPTGTISNIFGVSGGIEPFFNVSYIRKTESLGGETEEYKIFTPTIKELMEVKGIESQENLPEYVVTTHDVNYVDRIDVQAAWQQYIDSSISSTLNLPEDITIQEIKDAYIYGWKAGLKGMTVFRENCAREGILSNDDSETTEAEVGDFIESNVCPECQGELVHKQGCTECQHCGYSPCSV